MKDFLQFSALLLLIFGLVAAVPVLGIVVGVGVGVWLLWQGFKEHKEHVRRK